MKIHVYTTDHNGSEYRLEAQDPQAFASYGPEGSGFGYFSFRLSWRAGFDYQALGYAYRVQVYKGPWKCVFDGQIARITERTGDGDEIEIWALGWVHTATADVFNKIYCDTRYTQWRGAETPSWSFQPQKFSWDTSNRLYLKPRRGESTSGSFVTADDYTYIRYTFPFGESAVRLTADYEIELPASFPGKAQILAGDVLLWEGAVTGSGSLDLTASNGATYFEVRFAMTATGDVTAEDDSVYALFENVTVYSLDVSTLDQKNIADDIVDLLAGSGHGLADDTRRVAAPGFALSQAAFDTDQTPADVLTWACRFGDSGGDPLAWGVSFDDRRLFFLESQDLSTIKYTVRPEQAEGLERAGDWAESAQRVYALYTDTQGEVRRSATYSDTDMEAKLGGYYRKQVLNLSNIPSATLAGLLLNTWLAENGHPKMTGSYRVHEVRTADGRRVPFDEIIPGGLVQVQEFRAVEVEMIPQDYRDKTTTFMLVGVRVDFGEGVAELMPDASSDAFQQQMAVIEHLLGG